jgi:CRP-like cAMP-binding protein
VPDAENRLIETLPRKDRQRLLGLCEPVELTFSEILCEAGQVTQHAYFPINGFISLIAAIEGRTCLEVGMIGREGMLGAPLGLGVSAAPLRAQVQAAGNAWRVESGALVNELRRTGALQDTLNRYLYVRMAQLALASTCVRYHLIGPRLARWLLMSMDRAHRDHFHVTHESLACMLAVRRVGVTVAAGTLQGAGLIAYRRGEVRVLDRAGLEAVACSCYAADRQLHARHMR